MSERWRPSDREITDLLHRRSARPAPDGLAAAVLESLASERALHPSRTAGRSGRRGVVLLAAAALLLVGGALAAGSGLLRLPSVVPPVPEPSVIAVATASPDATFPSPSESAAPSASPIPVAGPGGVSIPTGSMGTPRSDLMAVRLLDGRVLVVSGYGDANEDGATSAELYDPATGTWSATGNMLRPTGSFPAVLLPDGTVLVQDQVYHPASGTWTATGPMAKDIPSAFRWRGITVTVLRDGKVLVTLYGAAQLYDPASGTWTATGKMNVPRRGAVATLLSDGKVLVAGGTVPPLDYDTEDSAEVYDPVTGSWTAIAKMHAPHVPLAAMLQPDGKVLVVDSTSFDVYDPATGTWTALPARPGISYNAAAQLSDGTVLLAGHLSGNGGQPACDAVDLYDPRTGSWTSASSMLRCGDRHRMGLEDCGSCRGSSFTPLLDGTVLVAGGTYCNGDGVCVSDVAAELYIPAGVLLPPLPALPSPAPPVFPSPSPSPTPTGPDGDPGPAATPAGRRSHSTECAVLDRHRRKQELRARDTVRGHGRRDVAARRVRDSERGPSRRHCAGDVPLPCRRGMDLREPATGRRRRRRAGQRGPDRHPRQDPDPS